MFSFIKGQLRFPFSMRQPIIVKVCRKLSDIQCVFVFPSGGEMGWADWKWKLPRKDLNYHCYFQFKYSQPVVEYLIMLSQSDVVLVVGFPAGGWKVIQCGLWKSSAFWSPTWSLCHSTSYCCNLQNKNAQYHLNCCVFDLLTVKGCFFCLNSENLLYLWGLKKIKVSYLYAMVKTRVNTGYTTYPVWNWSKDTGFSHI